MFKVFFTALTNEFLLFCVFSKLPLLFICSSQSLDEVIKDLMASVHKELSEKQSLAFSMTFLPTKLEFTTASAESTFVFEFSSPDARSSFEQAFEDAKKKLGQWEHVSCDQISAVLQETYKKWAEGDEILLVNIYVYL